MLQPVFILTETQLPENLGATARVIANFGIKNLHLISPLTSFEDPKALAMSTGALEHLDVSIFNNFEDAVADLNYVFATTAYPRTMIKQHETPRSFGEWLEKTSSTEAQTKVGVLFGPERTGLTNEQIARCFKVITVPVQVEFSSLNLAQAVAILAYECSRVIQGNVAAPTFRLGGTQPASQADLHQLFKMLEPKLDQAMFWRDMEKKPIMWRNLQNMFSRLPLTGQEIRTLCGMIDALTKGNE